MDRLANRLVTGLDSIATRTGAHANADARNTADGAETHVRFDPRLKTKLKLLN